MFGALIRVDAVLARSRPAWAWLGQLALTGMGIHLAADHLDDHLYQLLISVGLPWADPDQPLLIAAWSAVAMEILLWWRAFGALTRSTGEGAPDWRTWLQRSTLRSWILPLFWVPLAGAGAWSLGMAVEDLLSPLSATAARPLAWVAVLGVGWRLGITGAWQVCRAAPVPKRRIEGLIWAPIELLGGALAMAHGLPVWGWM